jgi:uncharacterized protein YbjT (DUF2867 family)
VILVTGATGQQGGATFRKLRERGFPVRAMTRDPSAPKARGLIGQGVEVSRGDMDDQASLTRAMDGVHGVYSVQNWHDAGLDGEIRQGIAVADAAKRSRISHFVYSSVAAADKRTGIPHFDSKFRVEEHIRGTGLHYTVVRPAFFMENWLGMREQIDSGALRLPLTPDTRLQMVAIEDIGGVAAAAFEHTGKWQDRAFELAGDELSMTDLANAFSRVAGREVRYEQVPWDEFEGRTGKEIATMWRWFQSGGFGIDLGAVRQDYPNITTFDRWLNARWHTAARTA